MTTPLPASTAGEVNIPFAKGRTQRVSPWWIRQQREQGWPDMEPEDWCHRCGARNPKWFVDRDAWIRATALWAQETGREGICCPTCFAELHDAVTGQRLLWKMVPCYPDGSERT